MSLSYHRPQYKHSRTLHKTFSKQHKISRLYLFFVRLWFMQKTEHTTHVVNAFLNKVEVIVFYGLSSIWVFVKWVQRNKSKIQYILLQLGFSALLYVDYIKKSVPFRFKTFLALRANGIHHILKEGSLLLFWRKYMDGFPLWNYKCTELNLNQQQQ